MSCNANFHVDALAAVPLCYIPTALLDDVATAAMVHAINGLDSNIIENIVRRIPSPFLPPDGGTAIMAGLFKRRAELAPVFGVTTV
jgi:hypothetical protein